MHTDGALEALNAREAEYNGRLYTRYEVSQMQRALERKVRSAKRQYLTESAAGLDTAGSAARLKQARQALNRFARDTGGRLDSARTAVQGFGRSEAGRATWKARTSTLTNAAGQEIIRVQRVTLRSTPNSITQRENAKGGIDRNYYGPDGNQSKQISNHDHGHPAESGFGIHGEHAHDYAQNEQGSLVRGPARELTDAERKENGDIL